MPNFEKMHELEAIVERVNLPRFARVKQSFDSVRITEIEKTIRTSIDEQNLLSSIKPGSRIAIAVGSRQISNLSIIVKEIVKIVSAAGAYPYIMPAMGSHGGATSDGQTEILKSFGIDESTMGVPFNNSMDVAYLGDSINGDPVYVASHLLDADGVIIINRVKPHPAFDGEIQSGITKMAVIGLGKQRGAEYCHQKGLSGLSERLQVMRDVVFEKLPILFGVAILENPYDETAEIHCIPADKVKDIEPELQKKAKDYMPQLLINPLDVLVVEEIGKNISGTGADPNVMCRFTSPCKSSDKIPPTRIVMLDLTEETHGAAAGMGQADIITKRLYDKIDYEKIYVNSITSTLLQNSFTPIVMSNCRLAIKAAVKTCNRVDMENVRIVYIKNTLEIGEILVSEALADEIERNPNLERISEWCELPFDASGELRDVMR